MNSKKILILTSRFPFPLDKGDKLRIYHQIKHLSKFHDIYLISLNTEGSIKNYQINNVKKYCKEIIVFDLSLITRIKNIILSFLKGEPLQVGYFYSYDTHKKIKSQIKRIKPDWSYAQLIRTAKYLQEEENNLIDYMDALSKGIERRVEKFPKILQPIIKREFKITKYFESKIFDDFKMHTIITNNDKNFIDHTNKKKIKIVANGVDTNYFKCNTDKNKEYDIIFVGNMSYPPNVEAAKYLIQNIQPIIEKKYNRCKILIGGTNPNLEVQGLKNKNVVISGWVEDIREVYSSGKIFVAPMFIGTGLQNKLLEAMSMGIPCVTTRLANKALMANSKQISIANNAEEFACNCINILKNKKLYESLQIEGLKFVKEKYDWNQINYKLASLFK